MEGACLIEGVARAGKAVFEHKISCRTAASTLFDVERSMFALHSSRQVGVTQGYTAILGSPCFRVTVGHHEKGISDVRGPCGSVPAPNRRTGSPVMTPPSKGDGTLCPQVAARNGMCGFQSSRRAAGQRGLVDRVCG